MQIGTILPRWLDVLAILFADLATFWRARRSIIVTREDALFVIRHPGSDPAKVLARVSVGTSVPNEILEALRRHCVVFELPPEKLVSRRLTVPIQAQEFLKGVIGHQIERLSPWPPAQTIYGYETAPSRDDPGLLDIRVFITSRSNIDLTCNELATSGLTPTRIDIRTRPGDNTSCVTLWNRPARTSHHQFQEVPRIIGMSLAALVFLSLASSLLAIYTTNSVRAKRDEIAARVEALLRHDHMSHKPRDLTSLTPAERAWVLKENAPAAILILDELTRSLPDSAYLTQLNIENTSLRITGLATDAPSLIAALQKSHHFSDVHFFSPTIESENSTLYRFSIAARVVARNGLDGN